MAEIEDEVLQSLVDRMRALPEIERRVIELRFGLTGEPPLALQETADRIEGLNRERVRCLEVRALKHLLGRGRRQTGWCLRGLERLQECLQRLAAGGA